MLTHDTMLTHEQRAEPLLAALIEIERYVGRSGWDQPGRLFALVPTAELLAAEPGLVGQITETSPGALSSIEQDEFNPTGEDLLTLLSRIVWPPQVSGCALVTERSFLATDYEDQIPTDPTQAADFVAGHPHRQDLRVVAGAVRDEAGVIIHCVARLSAEPEELLVGAEMAPALTSALSMTLNDYPAEGSR